MPVGVRPAVQAASAQVPASVAELAAEAVPKAAESEVAANHRLEELPVVAEASGILRSAAELAAAEVPKSAVVLAEVPAEAPSQ